MSMAKLSYSLIIMHRDRVIAVRDRFGNRPLCLGRVNEFSRTSMILENRTGPVEETNNKTTLGWIVSSESCVFSSIGAVMERQVIPGEILEVSSEGFRSLGIVPRDENESLGFCIFEYVYFARPDSYFEGKLNTFCCIFALISITLTNCDCFAALCILRANKVRNGPIQGLLCERVIPG